MPVLIFWHDGLFFKLKQSGISGNLLSIVTEFLNNRKQRVVLNDQNYPWSYVEAGVLQGFILGPLLFLICINNLPENLASKTSLFTGNSSLFSLVKDRFFRN